MGKIRKLHESGIRIRLALEKSKPKPANSEDEEI